MRFNIQECFQISVHSVLFPIHFPRTIIDSGSHIILPNVAEQITCNYIRRNSQQIAKNVPWTTLVSAGLEMITESFINPADSECAGGCNGQNLGTDLLTWWRTMAPIVGIDRKPWCLCASTGLTLLFIQNPYVS